ncbi:MAG: carboxypeptidase regulatory-like domain-containing protein [Acidobacteria bacterium]|nr:carboxypeptidase regulatory-like domain-containing protein [Acidobacteriota bacterium]
MNRLLSALALSGLCTLTLFAQTSSVSGTVTDPSGALIPNASLELDSSATGVHRETKGDSEGRYSFLQVAPGLYTLTAKVAGFSDVTVNNVRLLVATPMTLNVVFEKLGQTQTTISVTAEGTQVNTTDASLGNAIGDRPILQLPFNARNVVGLLAIQPGVTFIEEPRPGFLNDYRSGAVNGGKSDQANVTLDGMDVNDQENRSAFTSVLRVTLDSVQEFRTTTTNSGAQEGRTSGAQVALVTKAGTNDLHGSLYEFHRNTLTSANSWFRNRIGNPRETLIRNVYGVALGGPIIKNRLFIFGNYEGRRDRSAAEVTRTIPNMDIREGIFTYVNRSGGISKLTPEQVRQQDPLGIGANPAVLALYKTYPVPNEPLFGDRLNTSGYRFTAPTPLNWNTYVLKLDWKVDSAGRHSAFARGNLQNDRYANGLPQFPNEAPTNVFLENSKGYTLGLTSVLTTTLVSNFRFGLTRQGVENTGFQSVPYATLRDVDGRYSSTRGTRRITPVYQMSEDLNWTKGAHTIQFGGVIRTIRNIRANKSNSFSQAISNASWLSGVGSAYQVADAANSTPYRRQFNNLLGVLSELDRRANYDLDGNLFAEGAAIPRQFNMEEYEMYAQDTWKVTRGLTITAGLRYSLNPPVYEANGYQTSANIPLGDWFNTRGGLADKGLSQVGAGRITYNLASSAQGRPLYDYFKNWQPRLALAYSPQGNDGFSKWLFGGPGRTSIRAGFGMYYDLIGQPLTRLQDATALGFSTLLQNSANQSARTSPRFTGPFNLPSTGFPTPPKGGFPQTQPDIFQITTGVDDTLKAPYTMNMNFSLGREYRGGWFVQGSYVGRLSRRSLVRDDLAMPTNLKDPASGQTYFDAARILAKLAIAGTPTSSVQRVPFWENMWPGAAGGGQTATQNMYDLYSSVGADYTTALVAADLDCDPSCSKLGPYAIFNSQYSSLAAARSRGHGNYHAMQWTVRKRFEAGYSFDFNYTWSKSTDLSSGREGEGGTFGQLRNAWFPGLNKGVSDYDTTHIVSAQAVWEIPLGKGKKWLNGVTNFGDILVSGWQLSGIWRQTSGFANSILSDTGWGTNWNVLSFANVSGPVGQTGSFKNAVNANGVGTDPNIFANPAAAYKAFSEALPGDVGARNVIRGDGVFTIDAALAKRFKLFTLRDHPHTLQIRAEGFNITNSVRFDPDSINWGISNRAIFGTYTDQLGSPRVFQFGARYEF